MNRLDTERLAETCATIRTATNRLEVAMTYLIHTVDPSPECNCLNCTTALETAAAVNDVVAAVRKLPTFEVYTNIFQPPPKARVVVLNMDDVDRETFLKMITSSLDEESSS